MAIKKSRNSAHYEKVTALQAAQRLELSPQRINQLLLAGEFPGALAPDKSVGRAQWLIPFSSVLGWKRENPPGSPARTPGRDPLPEAEISAEALAKRESRKRLGRANPPVRKEKEKEKEKETKSDEKS